MLRFRLQAAERNATSVAYSSTYGSTSAFYLASAFQDVYLQPTGLVMCTGIVAKVPFFRGLLDKWKVSSPSSF